MSPRSDIVATGGWRGFVLPLGLVIAWSVAGAAGVGNPALLVPVGRVLESGFRSIASGELPGAIGATILRALVGSSIGAASGFSLGLLLGLSGVAHRALSPMLHGARQIALFAWIPLLSAWLGNSEGMKIALIALSAFFPVLLNVEAGCRDVPRGYREVGRLFDFDRRAEIVFIILPAAARTIISGLELAFAVAWIGTIGAEYLIGTGYMYASADGIGAYLAGARENARMDLVIVGVLTLAITGFALDRLVVLVSRRALTWRTPSH